MRGGVWLSSLVATFQALVCARSTSDPARSKYTSNAVTASRSAAAPSIQWKSVGSRPRTSRWNRVESGGSKLPDARCQETWPRRDVRVGNHPTSRKQAQHEVHDAHPRDDPTGRAACRAVRRHRCARREGDRSRHSDRSRRVAADRGRVRRLAHVRHDRYQRRPFVEAKELVGGYAVYELADLAEANAKA
jgi:hypothetical protein